MNNNQSLNQQNIITFPLNLFYDGNNYYFSTNNYVFLKILSDSTDLGSSNTIEQLLSAQSISSNQYEQNYIFQNLLNVGIGEDYTYIQGCNNLELLKKSYDGITAKIIVSPLPGTININNSNIINNSNSFTFYNGSLDSVNNLNISLYDSNFEMLNIYNNYSFTLNIVEDIHVLKETLINSKTNNVTSTGNYI